MNIIGLSKIKDVALEDAQITKGDVLYPLTEKYNIKISRSPSSDAVYIFKSRYKFILRIGHYMSDKQMSEFVKKYNRYKNITKDHPTYEFIEKQIQKYISYF